MERSRACLPAASREELICGSGSVEDELRARVGAGAAVCAGTINSVLGATCNAAKQQPARARRRITLIARYLFCSTGPTHLSCAEGRKTRVEAPRTELRMTRFTRPREC